MVWKQGNMNFWVKVQYVLAMGFDKNYQRKKLYIIMVKVLQLTVEVGKCQLPPSLPDNHSYILSVELTKELTAATSTKTPTQGVINFGMRLFVKLDKDNLDKIPICMVVLSKVDEKGERCKVASGQFLAKPQPSRQFGLTCLEDGRGECGVELQFGQSYVQARESKSKNNRSISSKSNLSQKQSSSDDKQKNSHKITGNFHSTGSLQKYDSKESLETFPQTVKVSRQQSTQNQSQQELETSVAISKPQPKVDQPSHKIEEAAGILTLQIKIDQLEDNFSQISKKLTECQLQLEQTNTLLEKERRKRNKLEIENEELVELLNVEQIRAKMANQYALKITRIFQEIMKGQKANFDQIQQKDQIVLLNQELQTELSSKQGIIDCLRVEIVTLKDKISGLEIKSTPIVSEKGSSIKKLQNLPGKELEKVKSQKKLNDRKNNNWSKKSEDVTKQTNGSKEQTNRNRQKQVNKVNIKKDVKAPVRGKVISHRNDIGPAKIPKGGKPTSSKQLKPQQKQVESQKKSLVDTSSNFLPQDLDSLHQPTNLMLMSRSIEADHPAKVEST